MTPAQRYSELASAMKRSPGVTDLSEGKGFGSSGQLKVDGRIFAMLVRDELVLKLPRPRVDELVAAGEGTNFDAGKGRPMRQWFVLSSRSKREWLPLAKEALAFVRG